MASLLLRVPRDIYTRDVDFTTLALQYPEFAKRLKTNKQLDFSDPESVRQLTKALLRRDFNLSIELPEDRLCPPIPNRFNYVLWIQDLLDCTSDDFEDKYNPNREVIGLDIGTGASAIYPLLACRQHTKWKFLVTETDAISATYALRNITSNGLQDRIRIAHVDADGSLLPAALKSFERSYWNCSFFVFRTSDISSVDFTMTNPPFYASETEMLESAKKKQRPPNSACTGGPMEMITPGGELAFVSKLIEESMDAETRERIQWFTSMLGKLASVSTLVEKLREKHCTNYAVTEFVQGQKTRRWAVAWSWKDLRPNTAVARGIPGFEKRLLPFPTDFSFDGVGTDFDIVARRVHQQVESLDLLFRWKSALSMGVGTASGDVWSRKARRRKAKSTNEDEEMAESEDTEEVPALVFKISLSKPLESEAVDAVKVHIRWLQGRDAVLFESFCGWLKRKIETA